MTVDIPFFLRVPSGTRFSNISSASGIYYTKECEVAVDRCTLIIFMSEVIHVDNKEAYMRGRMCGRLTFLLVVALELMIFCVGCARFDVADSGEALLYDVCDESMLPDELVAIIDRKKEKPFNLVYSNSTYTYIVIAAGMQERDDVGVTLDEMYKDDNAIYVKGVLRQVATPTDGVAGDNVSFPYIVVRIIKMDLPVVFR